MKPAVKAKEQAKPVRGNVEQTFLIAESSGRTRSSSRKASSISAITVKSLIPSTGKGTQAEPIEVVDTSLAIELDQEGLTLHAPAIAQSVLEKRKTAKDLPPGLPNVLWCALNSPEAQTGAHLLRDLLCVHDAVPSSTMVQKLMELMKYGPKAEGLSVHFKDPYRTELAAEDVDALVSASSRLVRQDSSALFGPSSWGDIEVLLSQSIAETENMISGLRLSRGLHLAARGAKLLSLMLTTELQGYNLHSLSSVEFDSELFESMPSVRLIRSHGVRDGLKAAVQHTTKCLVQHSRWIMDQGDLDLPPGSSGRMSDECCGLEAKACLDSLGSTTGLIAWLFCTEERVQMRGSEVAFVIRDAFSAELVRCLEDVLEMNERNKTKFVKRLKMQFLLTLDEDFCTPMVLTLGKMIGMEDALALVGLVAK